MWYLLTTLFYLIGLLSLIVIISASLRLALYTWALDRYLSGIKIIEEFDGFVDRVVSGIHYIINNARLVVPMVLDYSRYKLRSILIKRFDAGRIIRLPNRPYTDLIYYDGITSYTVRFPKRRGPRPYTSITNYADEDVTDIVERYIGPDNNFHGIPTTPAMLNYNGLIFKDSKTETTKIFGVYEVIQFT